ncbi:MAG TPA: diguanylate cyclase [Thermotogota bacterium]|nr:diguanylate cyclase [Thermotogota bacterium]
MEIGRGFNKYVAILMALLMFSISPISVFAANIDFTQEEREYIKNANVLQAASAEGAAPLSYTNSKGEIKGIAVSFLKAIGEISGLKFEYKPFENINDIINSDADLVIPAAKQYPLPNRTLSTPFLFSEAVLFYNSSLNPNELAGKRFAMVRGGTIPEGIREEDVLYFDEREDTFEAVHDGKADYSYSNTYSLVFYALRSGYDNIITIPQKMEDRAYGVAVREDDEILLSIINKSIEAIDEEQRQSLILTALAEVERAVTLKEIFKRYGLPISLISVTVIAILTYAVWLKVLANKHLNEEIQKGKRREEEIKYISFHDSLTGLYNRAYLKIVLESINDPENLPLSVVVADLNGLKMFNDSFGHAAGDIILQKAATLLKSACRTEDVVARTGGDEFIIVLMRANRETALQVVNRIHRLCHNERAGQAFVSISVGYATKNEPERDLQEVVKEAETMMYKRKLLESQSTRSAMLSALQATLQEKDIKTNESALRLIETASRLGERLQLSSTETVDLNLLARMLDIGYVVVDERILKKAGGLTDEEMAEVKKHPEAGFRIAESSRIAANIATYTLHHHEWWDGTGYPHGLKGTEIPLLSRVISIADAYDAMTHDRPYRKAMSEKAAIAELERCSGTQFDPELVPIFISVVNT